MQLSGPVQSGNLVLPLIDGEPAFHRICQAAEAAQHSVWVSVAFYGQGFAKPDGRGSLFDVLDAAAGRGLDVRGAKFLARWNPAQKQFCQHQKSRDHR